MHRHVGQTAVDDLAEGGQRQREPAGGIGEGDQHRVDGVRGWPVGVADGQQRGSQRPQRLLLAVGRQIAVADVVDPPGRGVDRCHGAPLRGCQQRDPVGEVACLSPGDRLAGGVGSVDVHRIPVVVAG